MDTSASSAASQAGAAPADDTPPQRCIGWPERAPEVGARPIDPAEGAALFAEVWHREPHVLPLDAEELARLSRWAQFVEVPPGRTLIRQDEFGDYLVMVLEGTLAVARSNAAGGSTRLAEARPGDMLGEMSLLDAGSRFSVVTTLSTSRLAVLQAEPFRRMMRDEPRIALALMAALSRRLSLRVRQLGARLGALLSST
ncbi:cyclic nucleotide-binding domain-containing protein [Aquincola sp. MAHUQ-54]|uniref:Cyclic nucleotide-binding domain-containing protein n=1 Tax=Aquincola agrisoli TaxID=3119538 RepID=A0AAW9QES2_9BURK